MAVRTESATTTLLRVSDWDGETAARFVCVTASAATPARNASLLGGLRGVAAVPPGTTLDLHEHEEWTHKLGGQVVQRVEEGRRWRRATRAGGVTGPVPWIGAQVPPVVLLPVTTLLPVDEQEGARPGPCGLYMMRWAHCHCHDEACRVWGVVCGWVGLREAFMVSITVLGV